MSPLNENDVLNELRKHAEGTINANDSTVLADYVWMLRHGGQLTSSEPIWLGIASHLARLNVDLNRLPPAGSFPRQVVYAVNGLMAQCFDYAVDERNGSDARRQLLELGWRISCAWDAIVAGDIEDLLEHVELEGKGRGISAT